MCAEHLQEFLREHRSAEAAEEAETETEAEVETLGPEGRERETAEGMVDRGEEWDPTKWERVVELMHLSL